MSNPECRDVDLMEDVVEDIEKRRHTRNPFNDRYVAFTLSSFHGDSIDLANSSVSSRVDILSAMQNNLLKKVNASAKLTGSNRSRPSRTRVTSTPNDVTNATGEDNSEKQISEYRSNAQEVYKRLTSDADGPSSFSVSEFFGNTTSKRTKALSRSTLHPSSSTRSQWVGFVDSASSTTPYFLNSFTSSLRSRFALCRPGTEAHQILTASSHSPVSVDIFALKESLRSSSDTTDDFPVTITASSFSSVLDAECAPLETGRFGDSERDNEDGDVEMADNDNSVHYDADDGGGGDEIRLEDLSGDDDDDSDDDEDDEFLSSGAFRRGGGVTSSRVLRQLRLDDFRSFAQQQHQKALQNQGLDPRSSSSSSTTTDSSTTMTTPSHSLVLDLTDVASSLIVDSEHDNDVTIAESTSKSNGPSSSSLLFQMNRKPRLPIKKKKRQGVLKLKSTAEQNLLPLTTPSQTQLRLSSSSSSSLSTSRRSKRSRVSVFNHFISSLSAPKPSSLFDSFRLLPHLENRSQRFEKLSEAFSLQSLSIHSSNGLFGGRGGGGYVCETIPVISRLQQEREEDQIAECLVDSNEEEERNRSPQFGLVFNGRNEEEEDHDVDMMDGSGGGGDEIRLEDLQEMNEMVYSMNEIEDQERRLTTDFDSTPSRLDFYDNRPNPTSQPQRKIPRLQITSFFKSVQSHKWKNSHEAHRNSVLRTSRLIQKILNKKTKRIVEGTMVRMRYVDVVEKPIVERLGLDSRSVFVALLHAVNRMNAPRGFDGDEMDVDGEEGGESVGIEMVNEEDGLVISARVM